MNASDKIRCATVGITQKCESCEGEFTCGPLWSCWCMKETVSDETREALKSAYQSCVCPDCLRKAEALTERPERS